MAEIVQLEESCVVVRKQMISSLLDLELVMMKLTTVSCCQRLLLSVMELSTVLFLFQQLHSPQIVMVSEEK